MAHSRRIGIALPLWGRPRITGIVLDYYAALQVPGVELVLVAMTSPEDPNPPARHPAWEYVEAPNSPLSDKWNAGVRSLKDRVDGLLVLGSDDLITAGYITQASKLLHHFDFVYGSASHFLDSVTGRMCRVRVRRLGAGRTLGRELLEKLDWAPWPEGVERGCDGAMDRRIVAVFPLFRERRMETDNEKRVVLDIKSDVNMWPYERLAAMGRSQVVEDPAALCAVFPCLAGIVPAHLKTKWLRRVEPRVRLATKPGWGGPRPSPRTSA